jgi:hypothetical protein
MQTAPPNPLDSPAEWARRLAIGTAGGLFMGATGGFGTFIESPLPERLLAWLVMFWAGSVIYSLFTGPAIRLGYRLKLPLWFSVGAALIVASAPMTWVTFVATTRIMHTGVGQAWANRYFQVLIVVTPIIGGYIALRTLMSRQAAAAAPALPGEPTPPATPPRRPAAFLARLPARLGRDLLCLEMEDHYVRAHTALGSDLILMRMRDAVAELDGVEGMQTHRSWWVARSAVEEALREKGALRLKLRNGLVVPVARATAPEVRAAGWLG